MLHTSKFFDNFGFFLKKYPNIDLSDFFSKGQVSSKRWVINELLNLNLGNLGTIFICAGWYGSLATFIFESNLTCNKIRSFDIDPACANIADTFNRSWVIDGWKFKASTFDILKMKYPTTYLTDKSDGSKIEFIEMPDTIINTSCEHIENFALWYDSIPTNVLIVLQSNNFYEIPEHINCSNSLKEFSNSTPMETVLYEGELNLEKYTRYMKIGYK